MVSPRRDGVSGAGHAVCEEKRAGGPAYRRNPRRREPPPLPESPASGGRAAVQWTKAQILGINHAPGSKALLDFPFPRFAAPAAPPRCDRRRSQFEIAWRRPAAVGSNLSLPNTPAADLAAGVAGQKKGLQLWPRDFRSLP